MNDAEDQGVSELSDESGASHDWYGVDAATFGDRLAAAREAAGMSQAQLARRLGIKAGTVRSWEEDLSEPRANRLSMMAGVLNVSMMWLLMGEGEGLDAPGEEMPLDADVARILGEMRDLRVVITQSGEKLARLEKLLRNALKDV